jgi:hypothetical protein
VKKVTAAGTFRFQRQLPYIANSLVDHQIGLEESDDGICSIIPAVQLRDARVFLEPCYHEGAVVEKRSSRDAHALCFAHGRQITPKRDIALRYHSRTRDAGRPSSAS